MPLIDRVRRFLDNDSQPGVATPNPPIPPSQGAAGAVAIHEMVQGLRDRVRSGELAFTGEREDKEAVATIEEGLEPEAEVEPGPDDKPGDETVEEEAEGEGEAEEDAEGEELEKETEKEGEESKSLKIALRGRKPTDPPFEIEVEDQETYERLQQNLREGMRREEFTRRISQVEEREDMLAFIDHHLEHDPAGFLIERVPEDVQESLVLHILARDGMLEKISEKLGLWTENPDKRALERAEMERDSLKKKGELTETFEDRRETQRATRVVRSTVESIALALPDADATDFVDDALRDVENFYRRTNHSTALKPGQVVEVIARRLERYGLTKEKANQLVTGQVSPVPQAKPDKAAAERLSQQANAQARRLVRASQGRRAAAAVAPAGTPPAPGRTAPPKGQGVKDRIGWFRENVLGQKPKT